MISQQTINEIFSTARVEEVISDFVQLKKSGSNYKALSPFTDEKTPSFMISPSKQIWKDFSSGKGGNVVSFLMEIEQFSYPEALRYLAKKYNIEIEEEYATHSEERQEEKKQKDLLFQIQEVANDFFQFQLWETEEGKSIALSYCKERGFAQETIKKFQLGWSTQQREAFTQFALEKGYSKELLEQSGLSIFREDYQADRFRERLMFPILSYSGRVLGFGGRILKNHDKTAKYINSPETEIYHKSKILYGLFQAKQEIVKKEVCYLVEGYTDVISLHQNGIQNVVSSSGTSLTEDQIKLIHRLTHNITLLFDGDAAGVKATLRSIDMILSQNMNVRVVLFPEGEDPDSYANSHSREETERFIEEQATDFVQFKINVLMQEVGDDPAKKADVIREVLKSIALIQDSIQREIYVQAVSRKMEISENALFKDLNVLLQSERRQEEKKQRQQAQNLQVVSSNAEVEVDPMYIVEDNLISLMINHGNFVIRVPAEEGDPIETTIIEEIIHQIEEDELEFTIDFFRQIFQEIKAGYQNDELRTGDYFLLSEDDAITQYTANALLQKYELSPNWKKRNIFVKPYEKDIQKDVEQSIIRYKSKIIAQHIQHLKLQSKEENFDREQGLKQAMQFKNIEITLAQLLSQPI